MDFKKLFAERIGGPSFGFDKAYKMEKIKEAKRRALQRFPERRLLDMGIGEPDEMADKRVVDVLYKAAQKKENRVYADNGSAPFREAVVKYMNDIYGVSLDPQREIVHCIGAKSALSYLPLCFVNPGDIVGTTKPGYPILAQHVRFLGGEVFELPLLAEHHYLPDLDSIPRDVARKMKLLSLNYPNNPTGAVATFSFFEKAVEWAHRHEVTLINDAAYAALVHDGQKPLSLLSIEGAKNIAIEIHSMSKAFNMTGWRLGWVCGQEDAVKAFSFVKNYCDSGQFLAIQEAACEALSHPEITRQTAKKYTRRMDAIASIWSEKSWNVTPSKAGFFLYAAAPRSVCGTDGQSVDFATAEESAIWFLETLGIICVPWDDVEPALRFSMTFDAASFDEETLFYEELHRRIAPYRFSF
ncbi:MAG: aminotransferase class I/II-fold pyridoxal phosphate-dependent enzyme [Puniceicoccales bacterium]|jgi:LL-diaminopimelate aminotransferase|nr:aminotransferase class I/II-fold pyridoxal phosphate-dependent enzyme [Puniceicoccales bacterium]